METGAAQVVHGPVPGDGGYPAAEVTVAAAELAQVTRGLQPGLLGYVPGSPADRVGEVAQQPRLGLAVEDPERFRVTAPRALDRRGQVIGPVHGDRAGADGIRRRQCRPGADYLGLGDGVVVPGLRPCSCPLV